MLIFSLNVQPVYSAYACKELTEIREDSYISEIIV